MQIGGCAVRTHEGELGTVVMMRLFRLPQWNQKDSRVPGLLITIQSRISPMFSRVGGGGVTVVRHGKKPGSKPAVGGHAAAAGRAASGILVTTCCARRISSPRLTSPSWRWSQCNSKSHLRGWLLDISYKWQRQRPPLYHPCSL